VVPYYIFQCRPVSGVKNQFQVPLKRACELIDDTRKDRAEGKEKHCGILLIQPGNN
jgi:L-lysine 2,3-aminomutase